MPSKKELTEGASYLNFITDLLGNIMKKEPALYASFLLNPQLFDAGSERGSFIRNFVSYVNLEEGRQVMAVGVEWVESRVTEAISTTRPEDNVTYIHGSFLKRDIVQEHIMRSTFFWVCSFCFSINTTRLFVELVVHYAPECAIVVTLHPINMHGLQPLFGFPILASYFQWFDHRKDMNSECILTKTVHVFVKRMLYQSPRRTLTRRDHHY